MKYTIILLFISLFSCRPNAEETLFDRSHSAHEVGTKYFRWIDLDRIDPVYGENRLINIQLWYPIDLLPFNHSYKIAPYYYEIEKAYQSLHTWSEEDLKLVNDIRTNAYIGPPVKVGQTPYPLIIFSPGLGINVSQYTHYAEHLAQSGYVVAGLNHLYESEYVLDNENVVFVANHAFHDSLKTLRIPEQITGDGYREAKGVRQKILAEDIIFCLEKITTINQSEFGGKIDTENVGVWGHSIGGAASIYSSILDKRFKAVLNIDGTPPTIGLRQGLDVPFMFIEDLTDYEHHTGYQKQHQRRNDFCELSRQNAYRILMSGTDHNSFLDIHYHTAENDVEKQKALKILQKTTSYMKYFFDRYLKNEKVEIDPIKSDTLQIIKFIKQEPSTND